MFSFIPFLTVLQAALAVASKRDLSMPMFFVALCNRVGRMGRRLERLLLQWRAGTLSVKRARASEKGMRTERVREESLSFPTGHGWLLGRVPDICQRIGSLELLLTQEECVRFLADVPAARKIMGVLERMLLPVAGKPVPKMKRAAVWPPLAWQRAVEQAGMQVGPTRRLEWN